MVLKRADKELLVSELTERLRSARAAVILDFASLPMGASMAVRRKLRQSGGSLQVVPKRLFLRVASQLGWPATLVEASGSLAVAWAEGPAKLQRSGGADLIAPAKCVQEYVQSASGARILGGVLEGQVLDGARVERLATLPSLEVLHAQLAGVIAGPLRGLVGVLSGVLRGLPAALQVKAQS